jgi:hypothetical protein
VSEGNGTVKKSGSSRPRPGAIGPVTGRGALGMKVIKMPYADPEKKRLEQNRKQREYRKLHKDKTNAWCRKWRAKHRDKIREYNRKHQRQGWLHFKYGMNVADYERMKSRQKGRCAICGKIPKPTPKNRDGFHVDHDHANNAIRSLLCKHCNWMIANACEDTGILRAGVKYLLAFRRPIVTSQLPLFSR